MGSIQSKIIELKNGMKINVKACESPYAKFFPEFTEQVGSETQFTRFSTTGSTPSVEKIAAEWQADFLRPDRLQLGAFQGDRMVGYLKFKQPYPDHVGFRHVADFGIMILKEFWQQGLARIMMNEMELYARSIGVQRIEARVRDGNTRAMKLFESLGFKNEGTRKGAAKVADQMIDEYYIGKILAVK